MDNNDINDVLNALSVTVNTDGIVKQPETLQDNNILDKVYKNISEMIDKNQEMIDTALSIAQASGDAEHIESYASLVKANNDMVKMLANIHGDREKLKQQKELKIREIESKEKIAEGKKNSSKKDGSTVMQQNNFLFSGPREAIFDLLSGKPEEKEKALEKLQELNPIIDV